MSLLSPKAPWSVLLTAPEISAIDGDGNPIFSAKRKQGRELFEQFNDFLLIENAPKLLSHLRKVVDVMRRSEAGLSPSAEITDCTEDEWDAALNDAEAFLLELDACSAPVGGDLVKEL